jgi:hypothetical protein
MSATRKSRPLQQLAIPKYLRAQAGACLDPDQFRQITLKNRFSAALCQAAARYIAREIRARLSVPLEKAAILRAFEHSRER